jgi:hypothetical protein
MGKQLTVSGFGKYNQRTTRTGRPGRKMKQYTEYWNPFEDTIGLMVCFRDASDRQLVGRFKLYPMR